MMTMVGLSMLVAEKTRAHCDTLNGPVVTDARQALAKSDVTPVLKWIKPEDEKEIRETFAKTLTVRAQGKAAQELADLYFFETLVRVHRAGEGAPYTGLKPAAAIEPIVAAADEALEKGSADKLAEAVAHHAAAGVRQRFERVAEARKHADHNVAAGRVYVAAYVEYVHYVEGLHTAAAGAGHAHAAEQPAGAAHHHGEEK